MINLRLQAIGTVARPSLKAEKLRGPSPAAAYLGEKETPVGGRMVLYERDKLRPGAKLSGQALLFQLDSTVYIPEGWVARVDEYRNLIIEREEAR